MPRDASIQAGVPAAAGARDGRRRGPVTADPAGSAVLTLLGSFRLQVGPAEVRLPVGAQRLLVVLALRGRQSRSRVAGALWPDSPEGRALGSLRTSLWRINQAAPALVVDTGGAIDLAPEVTVDARELMERTKALLQESPSSAGPLPPALGDGGELLPDWDDEWLADERERLRQLHLHVRETFAERLASEGKFGLALDMALGALRLDTLRESAHRSVIRIHLQEGNLSEARRAYATCRRVLEQELGVAPAPETTRMLGLPVDRRPRADRARPAWGRT
ncbi:BTAD domain-containing putative transcriptional regulator [Kitasatospora sp. NPDC087314]|uniref:AfsR/SARP family transcriptional regulator n=1 Tax=Kitasatospora sp. NPDC087314 TaxID=3364068 RepID=UPI00380F40F6